MRRRLGTLLAALLVLVCQHAAPGANAADSAKPLRADTTAPRLLRLRAYTRSSRPYAGDRRLFVTISPNGDHLRDTAKIGFTLTERATVHLSVTRTISRPTTVFEISATLARAATHSSGFRLRRPHPAPI